MNGQGNEGWGALMNGQGKGGWRAAIMVKEMRAGGQL